ncbi:MAG: putative metalloprotease CJM1_0395 family protein [Chromatiales bacterium]
MSSPEDILFTSSANRVSYVASSSRSDKQDTAFAGEKYSKEEQAVINELKRRDAEVRAHEQAHLAAAGQYAKGAASYVFQKGPDGRNYAVGGEVRIDTSSVPGDPEATLRKAEQIKRAAFAPATPSGQDRAVAAQAASMAVKARIELSRQQIEETDQPGSGSETTPNVSQSQQVQAADGSFGVIADGLTAAALLYESAADERGRFEATA